MPSTPTWRYAVTVSERFAKPPIRNGMVGFDSPCLRIRANVPRSAIGSPKPCGGVRFSGCVRKENKLIK